MRMTGTHHRVVLHDDLNRAVRAIVAEFDPATIAKAFVAGLRPRRFAHWSSLASFALASALPEHAFTPDLGRRPCGICGAYERVDAFVSDRFSKLRRTGHVRIDSLRYALYDLECFCNDERFEPDADDRAFFDAAISRIASVPPISRTSGAEKALGMLFPSRIERKLFLGALGVCGVMAAPERPGLWPNYVAFRDRAYSDASPYIYPVTWWHRSFGLDRDALHAFGLDAFLSQTTLRRLAGADGERRIGR